MSAAVQLLKGVFLISIRVCARSCVCSQHPFPGGADTFMEEEEEEHRLRKLHLVLLLLSSHPHPRKPLMLWEARKAESWLGMPEAEG